MIETYFVVFTAFVGILDYPQFQKKKKKKMQNTLNIIPT